MIVDTYTLTTTISAINPRTRQITLTLPDGTESTFKAGSMNTVKVGRGTDLSNVVPGESLRIQLTEARRNAISRRHEDKGLRALAA